jgi:hypothetical protein
VLDYLAELERKRLPVRKEDGTLRAEVFDELVASGPSQGDIAEALCLGRATVEKAIAGLRHDRVLRAFGPGERTNRYYVIEDRDLLRQVARGG